MKLGQSSPIASGTAGKHSCLTGLLKCENFGYAVKIIRDGPKYYLNCSSRTNMEGRLCTFFPLRIFPHRSFHTNCREIPSHQSLRSAYSIGVYIPLSLHALLV